MYQTYQAVQLCKACDMTRLIISYLHSSILVGLMFTCATWELGRSKTTVVANLDDDDGAQ